MLRETGSQLTQQAIVVEKERYPVLGNTVRQINGEDQLPVSRYSASYTTPLEVISTPNTKTEAEENSVAGNDKRRNSDPFKDGVYDAGPVVPAKDLMPSPLKPSARGGRVQKPVQDSKSVVEPRQTRTSSLRARLSAAQLDNAGSTKDAPNELVKGNRDSLLTLKEAQGRRSTTPPLRRSVSKRASRDSIGSNRAPALFVGGSRRPAHPRRPNSRGSHRDDYRVPSPPLPPNRPATAKPVSRGGTDRDKVKPRKSSIPVPRMVADRTAHGAGKVATPERKDMRFGQAKKEARDEIGGIYQEHTFADFVNELQATPPPAAYHDRIPELISDIHEPSVLEAIEESPQHTYQFKRLSVAAPKYGPTLKISPSAERYIMGNEEGGLLNKKQGKELDDRFTSKPASSATSVPTTKDIERPSSSPGLPRLSSRVGLIDPKVRERRAKSVDLGQVSPYRARTNSVPSDRDSRRENPELSAKASTDVTNDPFFDAPEGPLSGVEDGNVTSKAEEQSGNTIDEAAWISPLEKKTSRSSNSFGREMLALDDYLPIDPQEPSTDNIKEDDLKENRQAATTQPPKDTPYHNLDTIVKDFAPQLAMSTVGPAQHAPFTPEQSRHKQVHRSGHPPRNSSRTTPPDFTASKNYKSSPLTSENGRTLPPHSNSKVIKPTSSIADKKPPTPPKNSLNKSDHHEHNLGSFQGFDSSQLPIDDPTSKHGSATRDIMKRDSIPKRESAAHDSHRSHSSMSMSKGVLSNFRGLFHKRSSNESLQSSKKPGKSKASVDANGSPFPPISEAHSIHRPTLASAARARTSTPAASNPYSTPATTPSFASPQPNEVSTSTTLAMQLLEAARVEGSSPKKERLLKLGQFMVDAITQARDAEKAMEEAKQASRKAEVASALCKKSLGEVERVVKGFRNEMVKEGGFF